MQARAISSISRT